MIDTLWEVYKAEANKPECDVKAPKRSCGVYIRQAVWVRGQDGLRRLCDGRLRTPLILEDCHHYATLSKSHVGTHVLTANTFFS